MFSILGCGAIGSLVAWACDTNKLNYQLILRKTASKQIVRVQPFNLKNRPDSQELIEFSAPVRQKNSISHLILPVKAYQVESAIKALSGQIEANANIVLMHNGLGTAEIIRQYCPNATIIMASTTHGAFQNAPFSTVQTGLGETFFGYWDAKSGQVAPRGLIPLIQSFAPGYWDNNIKKRLWEKLAVNSVINPITGLDQIKNGELLKPGYEQKVIALVKEFCLVSRLCGLDFEVEAIKTLILTVAKNTAQNWSSMNRDIFYQRQTEIDFINGYLIKQAATHDLQLPHNQALFEQIKLVETSSHS